MLNTQKNIIKQEKGVTLIALIITIVVIIIVAGISITEGTKDFKNTDNKKILSELEMVQHAVVQRYTKYKLTKDLDLLVGTKQTTLPTAPEGKTWKKTTNYATLPDNEKYYLLKESDLRNLGIQEAKDEYIVNYDSGEVYNSTKIKVKDESNNDIVLYKSFE